MTRNNPLSATVSNDFSHPSRLLNTSFQADTSILLLSYPMLTPRATSDYEATMTTTPFEHSPLDPADPRAIQILELLPSRNLKGPIRCELHHHSLDQDVQYEALSYAWGDPEPGHTVFVNGSHA